MADIAVVYYGQTVRGYLSLKPKVASLAAAFRALLSSLIG